MVVLNKNILNRLWALNDTDTLRTQTPEANSDVQQATTSS